MTKAFADGIDNSKEPNVLAKGKSTALPKVSVQSVDCVSVSNLHIPNKSVQKARLQSQKTTVWKVLKTPNGRDE